MAPVVINQPNQSVLQLFGPKNAVSTNCGNTFYILKSSVVTGKPGLPKNIILSTILEWTFLSQHNQRRRIFDVGSDEEESPGGGGSPGAPVDHHLPSLHPRRPPPSSGTDTQKQCGAAPPRFGLPLLANVLCRLR